MFQYVNVEFQVQMDLKFDVDVLKHVFLLRIITFIPGFDFTASDFFLPDGARKRTSGAELKVIYYFLSSKQLRLMLVICEIII